MFSENRKISQRQAFRLLTYDLLGLGTLLVPTALSGVSGRDGIFGILVGLFIGMLYLWLIRGLLFEMREGFPAYIREKLGDFAGAVILAGYLVYFVLLAGYTTYLFADIVLQSLLREESFFLVQTVILLLVFYGIWEGIEGRARVYEILFWVVMLPLILMLFSALNEIRIDYWTPIFTEQVSNVLLGGYEVFLPLSLIFLVLFLGDYVEKREGLFLAGKRALLFSGGVYAVLYLILLGIFGAQALSSMKFPAVTLMSTVKISGGFLKRTDAFMFGIWFFTLYALLSSTVFYGATVLRALVGADGHNLSVRSRQKRERISAFAVILAVFGVACTLYRSKEMLAAYERFLWYIATPFVVLVPLLLWAAHFLGKKQLSVLALFLLSSTLLCGCNTAELQERSFPIELGIADTDSFAKEWLNVNQAGNRVVDYSHLKVMLLGKELLENEEGMEELLELLEEKADMPRNTYIVATENLKAMMEQTGEDGESVGNYLEQFFENVSEVKKRMYPTLGMLYQEKENRCETLFIPVVGTEDGVPVVQKYFVWKRGRAAGMTESAAALLSCFTQNGMEAYTLVLSEGAIRLTSPHNRISFADGEAGRRIVVDVYCDGETLYRRTAGGTPITEQQLEREAEAYMNEIARAALEESIDVTNSYRKLGGYKRDWYMAYQNPHKSYEEEMEIVYDLHVTWVNL